MKKLFAAILSFSLLLGITSSNAQFNEFGPFNLPWAGGGGGGGGSPTGAAGGDLSGTYPNPSLASPGYFYGKSNPGAADFWGSDGSAITVGTFGTGLCLTAGTVTNCQVLHDISGSGVAIVTGDASKTVLLGAFTYTLAQAGTAGFGTGWAACVLNIGATDATINATTSTFVGASGTTALIVRPGGWACPTSNGTNYDTPAGNYRTTIPIALTYVPGINPNNIPIANISQARTITGIRCNPEVLAGGAATISVVKAASTVALSAGTLLHSGSCNANSAAGTDQDLTVTVSTLAAGDRLGIVTSGTTIWTSSGVATGVVTVFVQ